MSARTGRYAVVKTDVSPEEAQVFLDGKYIGTADDFDGMPDYLYLGAGEVPPRVPPARDTRRSRRISTSPAASACVSTRS